MAHTDGVVCFHQRPLTVFASPGRYVQGPGATHELGRELKRLVFPFGGVCSCAEVTRLVNLAAGSGAVAVVGAGGGKASDTARAPRRFLVVGLGDALCDWGCAKEQTVACCNGSAITQELGQDAEHEKITRLGLARQGIASKTLDQLAGKNNTFGAVGAPDNPLRLLMSEKAAHCDGADYLPVASYAQSEAEARQALQNCRDWIVRQLNHAATSAGAMLDANGSLRSSQIPTLISCTFNGTSGRAKCNVLEALGLALHASQDFYSHSNWSDIAANQPIDQLNPPGIASSAISPWINPRLNPATQAAPITGCYNGFPESRHCNEGPGGRVKHMTLNKDTGAIDVATGAVGAGTTDRGKLNDNFGRSVRLAIADTRDKWLYFEDLVKAKYPGRSKRIICAIKQDNPSNSSCPL